MAEVDWTIEVVEAVGVAMSDGARDTFKEVSKESFTEFFTSLATRAFTLTFGSSLIGSGVLAVSKILICKWRAMAAKSSNPEIWDHLRFAELILNEYGDLLDNSRASRKTRTRLMRDAISGLCRAMVVSERTNESRFVPRIRFLMGLCGLMIDDVHTRMRHLDPLIEDASMRKTQLETESAEAAKICSELPKYQSLLVDDRMKIPDVKNVFALYSADDFHCRNEGKPWTGKGDDPLIKAMSIVGPEKEKEKIEKMVIYKMLKAWRDQKISQLELFLEACASCTYHRSFRPAFGTTR